MAVTITRMHEVVIWTIRNNGLNSTMYDLPIGSIDFPHHSLQSSVTKHSGRVMTERAYLLMYEHVPDAVSDAARFDMASGKKKKLKKKKKKKLKKKRRVVKNADGEVLTSEAAADEPSNHNDDDDEDNDEEDSSDDESSSDHAEYVSTEEQS